MYKAITRSRWWRLPDSVWDLMEPMLPKREARDHCEWVVLPGSRRQAMNGIFFALRTGCQWNALNETGVCSSSMAPSAVSAVAQGQGL